MKVTLTEDLGFAVVDADVFRVERGRATFRDEDGLIVAWFPIDRVLEVCLDEDGPAYEIKELLRTPDGATTRPLGCLCGMNSTIPCPVHNATYTTQSWDRPVA